MVGVPTFTSSTNLTVRVLTCVFCELLTLGDTPKRLNPTEQVLMLVELLRTLLGVRPSLVVDLTILILGYSRRAVILLFLIWLNSTYSRPSDPYTSLIGIPIGSYLYARIVLILLPLGCFTRTSHASELTIESS